MGIFILILVFLGIKEDNVKKNAPLLVVHYELFPTFKLRIKLDKLVFLIIEKNYLRFSYEVTTSH